MIGSWSKFFQDNFDKILLTIIFIFCAMLVIHMTHDARDQETILWGRELAGTVLGALLGLITGHALANAKTTSEVTAGLQGTAPKAVITTETK